MGFFVTYFLAGLGTATGWLSATVLLSLVLSLVGGALGVRGTRGGNRRTAERAAVTPTPLPDSTAILSRQP